MDYSRRRHLPLDSDQLLQPSNVSSVLDFQTCPILVPGSLDLVVVSVFYPRLSRRMELQYVLRGLWKMLNSIIRISSQVATSLCCISVSICLRLHVVVLFAQYCRHVSILLNIARK